MFQLKEAKTDDEIRSVTSSDTGLNMLEVVGYRGNPRQIGKGDQQKILQLVNESFFDIFLNFQTFAKRMCGSNLIFKQQLCGRSYLHKNLVPNQYWDTTNLRNVGIVGMNSNL